MSSKEALTILINVTAQVQANREVHAKIQEALKVIELAITKKEEEK
jgi:hypothetical protein